MNANMSDRDCVLLLLNRNAIEVKATHASVSTIDALENLIQMPVHTCDTAMLDDQKLSTIIGALKASMEPRRKSILFPATLRRLLIARDNDPAGNGARNSLTARAQGCGIEAITLSPATGDFNEDLRRLCTQNLRAAIRTQLAPDDEARFIVDQ